MCDDERHDRADVVAQSRGADVVAPPSQPKGPARLPPGSMLFAVQVDTLGRLEQMLARLAADWVHEHKKPTLRWIAGGIKQECAKYRRGDLVPKYSKFFNSSTSKPTSKSKGHMKLFVINRIAYAVGRRATTQFFRSSSYVGRCASGTEFVCCHVCCHVFNLYTYVLHIYIGIVFVYAYIYGLPCLLVVLHV